MWMAQMIFFTGKALGLRILFYTSSSLSSSSFSSSFASVAIYFPLTKINTSTIYILTSFFLIQKRKHFFKVLHVKSFSKNQTTLSSVIFLIVDAVRFDFQTNEQQLSLSFCDFCDISIVIPVSLLLYYYRCRKK